MKNKLLLTAAGFVLAMAVVITSCKKKEDTKDDDTSTAGDHQMAEHYSNDIVAMAGQSSENNSLSSFRLSEEDNFLIACATVTRDTVNKKVTVAFDGVTACLDGRVRGGSLMFDYSKSTNGAKYYRNPGFSCTVTSQNYVVEGNKVSVNKTVTNTTALGFNPATTNLKWHITGSVTVEKANGAGVLSFSETKDKTLLNTSDTINVYHGQGIAISWSKARIGITGSASGTTAKGESFTASVTSQLVRDMNCTPDAARPGRHPFIQGSVDFTPGAKLTRHVNFGSGNCDLDAVVTIGSNPTEHPIKL